MKAVVIPFALLVLVVSCTSSPRVDARPGDAAANPLFRAEPELLLEDGEAILLKWELVDDSTLWGEKSARLTHLEEWREAIEKKVGGTDPVFLMQHNREINPWLEEEHEEQRRINQLVEKGELGRVRSMNALESYLLDYHAGRYPLLERPSELGALILTRSIASGSTVRIYYLTDGDDLPPKALVEPLLSRVEADIDTGWDVRAFLHNHTFDFESEKGLLAIAAPSESDVQFIRALHERLDVDAAWIIDGFNSFELDLSGAHR